MYRILCLTAGTYIKLPSSLHWLWHRATLVPAKIREQIADINYYSGDSFSYLEFTTETAARWFISHRLVYNPRRQDFTKLEFMRSLFEFNEIPGWETIKLEFDVIPV